MNKKPGGMSRPATHLGGLVAKPVSHGGGLHSKIPSVSTDRRVAQIPIPSSQSGSGETRSKIYTYFTGNDGASVVLYNGDRQWAKLTLTLETAGPVCVGDASTISPVLSGKGQLLQTGIPTEFTIAKGTRLYIAATSISRVKVEIAPYPWMEQIVGLIGDVIGAISSRVITR